jgi:hypothetical protein
MRSIRARFFLSSMALACLSLAAATGAAATDNSITVYADQAKILKVAGSPASVVIGNPMVADVTIQGGVLAVHGRHFGNTNLIILDNNGNELAALQVNVIRSESNSVSMYKGGPEGKIVGKFSYVCAPDCESVIMPVDDNDYNAAIAGQIATKSKEAMSSAQSSGAQ